MRLHFEDLFATVAPYLVILSLLVPLWAVSTCSSAKVLQVGIEHSETLAPVPEELQAGKTFKKNHTKQSSPDRWAIIPSDTAGKWRLVRKFDGASVDLRTGKRSMQPPGSYTNSVSYIGYQMDNAGKIWTSADIESRLPHSDGTYLIPQQWELKQTSDHSFTVVKRGVSVSVDPDNHVIRETKQLETFAAFNVVGPDRLIQKYSTQWFDQSGEAIKLTEGQTEMEKAGAFEPVNELNGIDIKSSFRRFLREQ